MNNYLAPKYIFFLDHLVKCLFPDSFYNFFLKSNHSNKQGLKMNVSKLNPTCLLLSQKQGRANVVILILSIYKRNEIFIQQNMSIKSYSAFF